MTRPQETFTDMLARLFPMPGIQLGINSPHSKCITFQVFLLTPLREGRQQFSTSPS